MRAVRTTNLTFYASQALVLLYGGHKVAVWAANHGNSPAR